MARSLWRGADEATLLALAKDAYVRGDAEIDYLESIVDAILHGRPVALLQPGERVLTRRHLKVWDGGGFACVCPQCEVMRAQAKRGTGPRPKKGK